MNVSLSKRLEAIGNMVTPGLCVADIGTDHALLPIWLVESGRAPSAIAMDVNRGPLLRAQEGIRRAGLEDKITTRLSDGFEALRPGEAQCAVIAGMGGSLMIRILSEGMETAAALDEIICSPQSEIAAVRRFVREQGFEIDAEDMVEEDGKFYQMFRIRKKSAGATPAQKETAPGQSALEAEACDRYGRFLMAQGHPVLLAYLQYERHVRQSILRRLRENGGASSQDRILEVEHELEVNEAAMKIGRNAASGCSGN